MRIHDIQINNFQRISALHIQPQAPILMVTGHNEAGKSSLHEAIKIALTGESTRVRLKKDWREMLRDGAKGGAIALDLGEDGSATVDLKSWKREANTPDHPALPILLDPARFAAMNPSERRSFLFDLMGVQFSGKVVAEKMIDRGASETKVNEVLPMLRSGFPAAMEAAKDKAKEARGGWKATTGETYGSAKAENWQAEIPESSSKHHAELQNQLEDLNHDIKELATEVGAARAAARAFEALDKIQDLQALADQEPELQEAVQSLVERLRKLEAEAPPEPGAVHNPHPCPHCGGLTAFIGGKLVAHEQQDHTAADIAKWHQYQQSVKALQQQIADTDRQLDGCRQAVARIAEIRRQVEGLTPPENINAMEEHIASLEGERDATRAQLETEAEKLRQAMVAEEATSKAASYHEQVKEWEAIADMLSPSGIPSEILQSAIKPFNKTLAEAAEAAGWDPVQIDPEMEIRIGGRLHALGSESARWRADAMLAYAIATAAGLRFFALDRVDVLDLSNRSACMKWLHGLAIESLIDCALVFGTFKNPPQLPASGFHTIWLEAGAIATTQEKAA